MIDYDNLKITNGFWYVASPYSKYPGGLINAWIDVCKRTADLLKHGVPVYSPIAHTHPLAIFGEIDPYDHTIWLPADKPMMDAAHGLIVLPMEGWMESYGVKHEIDAFASASKPIVFLED